MTLFRRSTASSIPEEVLSALAADEEAGGEDAFDLVAPPSPRVHRTNPTKRAKARKASALYLALSASAVSLVWLVTRDAGPSAATGKSDRLSLKFPFKLGLSPFRAADAGNPGRADNFGMWTSTENEKELENHRFQEAQKQGFPQRNRRSTEWSPQQHQQHEQRAERRGADGGEVFDPRKKRFGALSARHDRQQGKYENVPALRENRRSKWMPLEEVDYKALGERNVRRRYSVDGQNKGDSGRRQQERESRRNSRTTNNIDDEKNVQAKEDRKADGDWDFEVVDPEITELSGGELPAIHLQDPHQDPGDTDGDRKTDGKQKTDGGQETDALMPPGEKEGDYANARQAKADERQVRRGNPKHKRAPSDAEPWAKVDLTALVAKAKRENAIARGESVEVGDEQQEGATVDSEANPGILRKNALDSKAGISENGPEGLDKTFKLSGRAYEMQKADAVASDASDSAARDRDQGASADHVPEALENNLENVTGNGSESIPEIAQENDSGKRVEVQNKGPMVRENEAGVPANNSPAPNDFPHEVPQNIPANDPEQKVGTTKRNEASMLPESAHAAGDAFAPGPKHSTPDEEGRDTLSSPLPSSEKKFAKDYTEYLRSARGSSPDSADVDPGNNDNITSHPDVIPPASTRGQRAANRTGADRARQVKHSAGRPTLKNDQKRQKEVKRGQEEDMRSRVEAGYQREISRGGLNNAGNVLKQETMKEKPPAAAADERREIRPPGRNASRWEQAGARSSSIIKAPAVNPPPAVRAAAELTVENEVEDLDLGDGGGGEAGRGGGGCRLEGRVENWEPSATADLRASYKWKDEKKASMEKIKRFNRGGEALRELIHAEVIRLDILRHDLFC